MGVQLDVWDGTFSAKLADCAGVMGAKLGV